MAKIKVGDRFESNKYGWIEVIEYNNAVDITVKFDKTEYVTNAHGSSIRKGKVKDKLHPSVYGVGFLGVGGNYGWFEGKHTKEYDCWQAMLKRCYSEKKQERCPTYRGCSVCKDWHNFQVFASYYETNHKEGYHLDKDLLFKGNKVYSPETCVFVPQHLNNFITDRVSKRGKYKVGVVFNKGSKSKPYQSQINNNNTGKLVYLGCFSTEDEAYEAWLTAKLQQALEYKPEMDDIDERIYPNVVEIIKEM